MLVPCGRQPNATCTPFAFSLSGSNGSQRRSSRPSRLGMQVGDVLVLPRRDGGDLRVRVPQQDLDQFDGGVTRPAEDGDLDLVHVPVRLRARIHTLIMYHHARTNDHHRGRRVHPPRRTHAVRTARPVPRPHRSLRDRGAGVGLSRPRRRTRTGRAADGRS